MLFTRAALRARRIAADRRPSRDPAFALPGIAAALVLIMAGCEARSTDGDTTAVDTTALSSGGDIAPDDPGSCGYSNPCFGACGADCSQCLWTWTNPWSSIYGQNYWACQTATACQWHDQCYADEWCLGQIGRSYCDVQCVANFGSQACLDGLFGQGTNPMCFDNAGHEIGCPADCDAHACEQYCQDQHGLSTDWTGSCTQGSCLCAYKLPPVCSDSSFTCSQNCGETVTAPGCSNTYTCPTNTCESLGQTTGSVCGVACCTEDECGVCNGPGKVCGQCGYTGPTGGCDGCGNTWEDVCGEPCGDGSSCACNGPVNACGECNGPTGGCDGCGNVWYDACGQPCGDGSECSPPGGGGMCPDYGAGMCGDTRIEETISAGPDVATSRSVATNSALQPLPEERHRRLPEERAARAADAVRLLKAWRVEATHRLKMTPAERVQLGKILEDQITALQRGVKAGGGRRQAQLQASAGIAKLLGAQRFARYEAVRTEWMTRNQAKPPAGPPTRFSRPHPARAPGR